MTEYDDRRQGIKKTHSALWPGELKRGNGYEVQITKPVNHRKIDNKMEKINKSFIKIAKLKSNNYLFVGFR